MTGVQTAVAVMLAAVEDGKELPGFPLHYQIASVIMAALFLWTFSIARDPRGWRRLYQAKFTKKEDFSVNRNKQIDEGIKKYGIPVSMVFLLAAVGFFLLGITYRYRHTRASLTQEEKFLQEDAERIMEKKRKPNVTKKP